MLRANHAVRLGLRAAARNPELAFGKALLDQGGTLLSMLPLVLVGLAVAGVVGSDGLGGVLLALAGLARSGWALLGAGLTVAILSFTASAVFWSGAVPVLAADAEMNARPPSGNFLLLAGRGFARVLPASFAMGALGLVSSAALSVAVILGIPAFAIAPGPGVGAGLALVLAASIVFGVLFDLLSRVVLVRAAAFGDNATQAFGRGASLFGARLGSLLVVAAAFLVLELIVATAAAAASATAATGLTLDPGLELLALGPRIAVGLAFAAVFAYLEVAKLGAIAAIAADAEGLLGEASVEEKVIEALPVAEPVIEALPVPDEPKE